MDFSFFDLVFPMKLKPLTYKAPKEMEGRPKDLIVPGAIVEAELKKTVKRAVVLGRRDSKNLPNRQTGNIKQINSVVDCPALGTPLVELIRWMASYYMVPEGSAVKVMWGGEVFETPGPRSRALTGYTADPEQAPMKEKIEEIKIKNVPSPVFSDGLAQIRQTGGYGAFLLHAPALSAMEFILAAIQNGIFLNPGQNSAGTAGTGVIVTCPTRSCLSEYEAAFAPVFGGRLCLLHGGLTPAQKRLAYARILKGEADIVLGTRVAVFAPLKHVSLIAVTGEEDPNYKNQEDVKYGAREAAVMRAWLEKARIILSSECPSAESYMNTLKGKYRYIRLEGQRPHVRLIRDRRKNQENKNANKVKAPLMNKTPAYLIDNTVKDALSNALKKGKSALLLANRQGHSVPYCEECGHFERCPSCGTALVFHKKGALLCDYCGHSQDCMPETCGKCGGHSLKPLGAGIERLAEEIKELLPMASVRTGGRKGQIEDKAEEETGDEAMIFLGTKNISKEAMTSGAGAAALIHPESAFFKPGFRARERLFSEINHIAGRLSPGGVLYIQTQTPELFQAMKDLDYGIFIETELEERKALGYPPFSRLAQINIKPEGKVALSMPKLGSMPEIDGVEVLGPVLKKDERGKKFHSILIKAPSAQALRNAITATLRSIKSGKVTVDIDPV